MAASFESRRRFLREVSGVGVVGCFAGCTAVGTVGADIVIENTGRYDERTEYYIAREGTTTEARSIDLEPEDKQTVSVEIELGDSVVVSKGELGYECTLGDYICRNPTIEVDTGFGALGIGAECFNIRPQ